MSIDVGFGREEHREAIQLLEDALEESVDELQEAVVVTTGTFHVYAESKPTAVRQATKHVDLGDFTTNVKGGRVREIKSADAESDHVEAVVEGTYSRDYQAYEVELRGGANFYGLASDDREVGEAVQYGVETGDLRPPIHVDFSWATIDVVDAPRILHDRQELEELAGGATADA